MMPHGRRESCPLSVLYSPDHEPMAGCKGRCLLVVFEGQELLASQMEEAQGDQKGPAESLYSSCIQVLGEDRGYHRVA